MRGRLALLLLCLLTLAFVQQPWLQFVARFFLLLGLLSWFAQRSLLRRFSVVPEFVHYRAFAHERVVVTLSLRNASRLPLGVLGVCDHVGALHTTTPAAGTLSLASRREQHFSYQAWSERRGVYQLGPLQAAFSDPLGIFPVTRSYAPGRSMVVFPAVRPADVALARGVLGSQRGSLRVEHQDPLETRGLRPWMEGDELRSIHWKQTARRGEPIVREYPRLQDVPWQLILNLRLEDFHPRKRQANIERCIEAAAAILVETFRMGTPCGLTLWGGREPELPGGGRDPISAGLERLAVVEAAEGHAAPREALATLDLRLRPHLVVVSPPLATDDFLAFERLLPRVRSLKWLLFDEHVERPGTVDVEAMRSDARIDIWRLSEQSTELELRPHA